MSAKTTLNPKQIALVSALLEYPTVKRAAEACGMTDRAAYHMLEDHPAFAEEYRRQRRRLLEHSVGILQSARSIAIQTLVSCTRSDVSPSVRVAAARTLLELADRAVELGDHEQRLQAIEAAQQSSSLRVVGAGTHNRNGA